ncbi:MAG: hypothetical protein KDI37_05515 [Xanthomonadales bacterium]|nr:hypothetical protein [Xanthomonadales bacterium]
MRADTPIGILLILGLASASAAQAQLLNNRISSHPAQPQFDRPWRVLLEDQWPTGCGGQLFFQATAERFDLIAVATTDTDICPAVVSPFRVLVDPRELAPEVDFADQIELRYLYDAGDGAELRQSRSVSFSDVAPPAARLQTGSWVTPDLASSGLFIDQQGDEVSMALLDYDADGGPVWLYGAGQLHGDVLVADLLRLHTVECVTEPCPRALPDAAGRIELLVGDRNALLASLDAEDLFPAADGRLLAYQRLDFRRTPELQADDDFAGSALPLVPDFVGRWVAGVSGLSDGRFAPVRIRYVGLTVLPPVTWRFAAERDGSDPATPAEFFIDCNDQRLLDGDVGCELIDYRQGERSCQARFAYTALAEERLSVPVNCGTDDPGTRFELFRLD